MGWIFLLSAGLLLFLFSIKLLSGPMELLGKTGLQARLSSAGSRPVWGLLWGAAGAVLLQSSSAFSVLLVGLSGAGVLSPEAAAVLLMGANVGTTLTPWLFGLLGLSQTIPLEYLCPLLALLGLGLLFCGRNGFWGKSLIGLSLLLFGMKLMQAAALDIPGLSKLLPTGAHPIRGLLMGTAVTAVLQSSSAAIVMLQALCAAKTLTIGGVIPLLIGLNLGTCVTALLASASAGRNARQAAAIHVRFNAIGGLIWLTALALCAPFQFLQQPATAVSIAVLHSLFNLSTAVILLPLRRYWVHSPSPKRTALLPRRRFLP